MIFNLAVLDYLDLLYLYMYIYIYIYIIYIQREREREREKIGWSKYQIKKKITSVHLIIF